MGNIISWANGNKTITYVYDLMGQLIRVNDPTDPSSGSSGTTWTFEYDRGGNILNKKRYAYTTGTLGTEEETIAYGYDATWKDKLVSYNGTPITYDAIGNPLNDGTWNYVWENGRQLKQMSSANTTAVFAYDHDGLRVRKTVNNVVTNYTLHGKNIVHMTRGDDILHFFYDAANRPAVVVFNGTKYGYVHNLQGDICRIIDASGSVVVQYKYDSWGKVLSTTGSLASTLGTIQPFRYRGYVYDVETGLYYLRSRYYNQIWQRFDNKDKQLTKNVFAYCSNDPINNTDSDGTETKPIVYYINTVPGVPVLARSIEPAKYESIWLSRGETVESKTGFGSNNTVEIEYEGNNYYLGVENIITVKPSEAVDFFGYDEVKWNAVGQAVTNVQFALFALGYYEEIDQIGQRFGRRTKDAISKFQEAKGITSCTKGDFNWETKEALWRDAYSKVIKSELFKRLDQNNTQTLQ